jgi:hypothetical protein
MPGLVIQKKLAGLAGEQLQGESVLGRCLAASVLSEPE